MSEPDGPAVLLLHGQPGAARDWNRVVAALDGRARAIAVDRPGWDGRSQPRDLPGNARAALEALDAERVGKATLVGHSLGAAVAVWAAAEHPERVGALVLAAPAANRASLAALDRWLSLPVAGSLTSAASLTGLGLALSAAPLRRRIARRAKLEESYLRESARVLLSSWGRHAFVTEQRSLVRDLPRLEEKLAAIQAPTFILTGSEDRIVPAAAPRTLAGQIAGARLIELDGAGHLLPQLHAQQLVDAVMLALAATTRE
ncbi:MAG: alpha/beta hydrolase [Solirubrobacteraceae bacterium]